MEANPWTFEKLEEFLFFCCPECNAKEKDKSDFIVHAIESHPRAYRSVSKFTALKHESVETEPINPGDIYNSTNVSDHVCSQIDNQNLSKDASSSTVPSHLKLRFGRRSEEAMSDPRPIQEMDIPEVNHLSDDYQKNPLEIIDVERLETFEHLTSPTEIEKNDVATSLPENVIEDSSNDLLSQIETTPESSEPEECAQPKLMKLNFKQQYPKLNISAEKRTNPSLEVQSDFKKCKCTECEFTSNKEIEVHTHYLKTHSKEQIVKDNLPLMIHKCTECKRIYANQLTFDRHVCFLPKKIPVTRKCDQCDFTTKTHRSLRRHILTHLTVRFGQRSKEAKSDPQSIQEMDIPEVNQLSDNLQNNPFDIIDVERLPTFDHLSSPPKIEKDGFATSLPENVIELSPADDSSKDPLSQIETTPESSEHEDCVQPKLTFTQQSQKQSPSASERSNSSIEVQSDYNEMTAKSTDSKDQIEKDNLPVLWKCTECKRTYANNITFDRHVCFLPKKIPVTLKCDQCDFTTTTKNAKANLRSHMKTHLKVRITAAICSNCGKEFLDKQSAKVHEKVCKELQNDTNQYSCDLCPVKVIGKRRLNIHQRRFHPELAENSVTCEFCGKVLSKKTYRQHIARMHPSSDVMKKIPCQCKKCESHFDNEYDLNSHQKQCLENLEDLNCCFCISGPWYSIESLKKHAAEKHKRLIHKCEKCKKVCSRLKHDCVTKKSRFVCPICLVGLNSENALSHHKLRVHNDLSISHYTCEYCSEKFLTQDLYSEHVNKKHTKEKYFECDMCDYKGLTKNRLASHRKRVHKLEPFGTCNNCGKDFYYSPAYKNHLKKCKRPAKESMKLSNSDN